MRRTTATTQQMAVTFGILALILAASVASWWLAVGRGGVDKWVRVFEGTFAKVGLKAINHSYKPPNHYEPIVLSPVFLPSHHC